jgi:hypothetical protein
MEEEEDAVTLFERMVEESRRIPVTLETKLREYAIMGRWFDEISRKWVYDAPRAQAKVPTKEQLKKPWVVL